MTGLRARPLVVLVLAVGLVSCTSVPIPASPSSSRPSASPGVSGTPAETPGSPSASPLPSLLPATEAPSPEPSPQPSPSPSPTTLPTPTRTPTPTPNPTSAPLSELVGQKLVVAMSGFTADSAILARIRAGQVGGIILFGFNIGDADQLRGLTRTLQGAAAAGGQPPLIISTDQEGGSVKRVPWIPPTLSPPQIGATGDSSVARDQGRVTGAALHDLGINLDLAPVADLPFSTASLLYQQGRTFAFDQNLNASLVDAFAAGLAAGGAAPTLKHFPGLGYAQHDTDTTVVTLNLTRTGMNPGLLPYQRATVLPLVMLSNAVYTVFDSANAAGWSPTLIGGLLRHDLGYRGATITDSLKGAAAARGVTEASLAIKAATAGADLILVTSDEAATPAVYDALLAAARDGQIPLATLRDAYARILALKASLP